MRVYITLRAQKDLDRLPNKLGSKIYSEITKLAENPYPMGSKKLQGWGGMYRIRIGDYRVIYEVGGKLQEVVIAKIKHRKDVYR